MRIFSVFDPEFERFGRVLQGNYNKLLNLIEDTPLPDAGTIYCPSDEKLEDDEVLLHFKKDIFGDMDVQLGYCNGYNQKLNCLEYHKGNEVNLSNNDFILLLGSYFDVKDGKFDTKNVVAFKVPKRTAVEIYSTTLHYAPCGIDGLPFKVLVALPKGTNVHNVRNENDPTLWATNKWLLAHKDSNEAKDGAYIGLVGENLNI